MDEEIARLRTQWSDGTEVSPPHALLVEAVNELDRFDRAQLEDVVRVCTRAKSLSAAGR